MAPRILFVCTGNICRSPMAELLLRHRLRDHPDAVSVSSAGVAAMVDHPIHPLAADVLGEHGVESGDFRARYLTPAHLTEADLVLTMAREHRDAATSKAPMRWRRIAVLREFDEAIADGGADVSAPRFTGDRNRPALDIEDPMGRPREEFERVATELDPLIDRLATWVLSLRD
ncbi:arsenate reductase/protein-tyrosine-phosphatase family protein [Williamsia deligens]|uniref:protein-tyrosine-phosphatase n=1 Tax=Williamsia deligens TaxID=321325 RepID=A0ABW3G3C8_9NOCA|nr:low molecular weight phosphotyrosine protein phosphatase [Williamsia deligens]MCP2194540.1 protein-tyrosine phosphatase [Williamsia deligens]